MCRFIAERPPQHEDALRQIRLFDDRIRPHAHHEVIFFNRPATVFEKDFEDIEGLGRHHDRLPIPRESPPRGVEREGTESVDL
jgi:hypothetical protein